MKDLGSSLILMKPGPALRPAIDGKGQVRREGLLSLVCVTTQKTRGNAIPSTLLPSWPAHPDSRTPCIQGQLYLELQLVKCKVNFPSLMTPGSFFLACCRWQKVKMGVMSPQGRQESGLAIPSSCTWSGSHLHCHQGELYCTA